SAHTEIGPQKPLYRAVEVLDVEPVVPPEVEEVPLDVVETAPAPDAPVALPAAQQEADTIVPTAAQRSLLGKTWWAVRSGTEWLFGFAALLVGLAVLAAIPVLNLLSLGYLLESSARIARSGRVRHGFIGGGLAGGAARGVVWRGA